MTDPLAGWKRATFSVEGRAHDVYRAGSGPAVVVIHEVPDLHPGVIAFGRRLVDAGYTVYLPSLFGRAGAPVTNLALARAAVEVCVSREFAILGNRTSRVVTWLRALAAAAHAQCGGPGVGAVGMCFTGGFALAMAVEPAVLAPVLSQPSLPAPITRGKRAALGIDRADLDAIRQRTREDGLCALGLRFSGDVACSAARFDTLRRELGDAFTGIEIDSSPGNPHRIAKGAHSVLTVDLVDEPGHPTRDALDEVMAFLAERLQTV